MRQCILEDCRIPRGCDYSILEQAEKGRSLLWRYRNLQVRRQPSTRERISYTFYTVIFIRYEIYTVTIYMVSFYTFLLIPFKMYTGQNLYRSKFIRRKIQNLYGNFLYRSKCIQCKIYTLQYLYWMKKD
jgi:hypothetical protein